MVPVTFVSDIQLTLKFGLGTFNECCLANIW